MEFDGNWVVAIIMAGTALVSVGISHGWQRGKIQNLSDRLSRLQESVDRRVSVDKYEEHQSAQDKKLDEIETEARENIAINRHIESKVDKLDGKTDVIVKLLERSIQDR